MDAKAGMCVSYIKSGICEKCGNRFYWSVGHPTGWDKWMSDVEDMPSSQQWWFSFGNLCSECAPLYEEEVGETLE